MLNGARVSCLVLVLGLFGVSSTAVAQDDTATKLEEAMGQIKDLGEKIKALEKRLEEAMGKEAATPAQLAEVKEEIAKIQAQLDEVRKAASEGLQKAEGIEAALMSEEEGGMDLFEIGLEGYLRTEFVVIQDDAEQTDFIGLNDGFVQGNARLGVVGSVEDFSFRLQFDGAVDRRDARNTATGEVKTELKDAWMKWGPSPYLSVQLGQLKPPFDAEELRSTTDTLFVSRAVESRGVQGVEGIAVSGLSVDRQVGLQIASDPLRFGELGIGGSYSLALMNGNSANEPLNDNDSLALYGRLELHYEDILVLGVAGFFNDRSTGELADLIDDRRVGLAADLSVQVAGVIFRSQFMQVTESFPDLELDVQKEEVRQGFHVEVGYDVLDMGIIPAYRFAFFDPTSSFEVVDPSLTGSLDRDELTHHTFGLTWNVPNSPVKLQGNYTITIENPARVFNNDRLELLGQLVF